MEDGRPAPLRAATVGGRGQERGLKVRIDRGVARVTLDRQAQRNALSLSLLVELGDALLEIGKNSEIRAIVIGGAGPAFSAGHDLRELQASSPEEAEALFARCSEVMYALHEVPQPVVARVHGVATAAGCQLVAACDLAVAARSASFATPGVRIGLFCSTPAVPLVRAIGRKRALEMLLSGAPIDAGTALAWGLVNRVVADDALDQAVDEILAPILAASAATLALGKRAFYRQVDASEGEAYLVAAEAMCVNSGNADAREGVAAFLEKRPPVWKRT